jgi:hypothetical protein
MFFKKLICSFTFLLGVFFPHLLKAQITVDTISNTLPEKAINTNDTTIEVSSNNRKQHAAKTKTIFVWDDVKARRDTIKWKNKNIGRHSPLYATLFSLALPGLGQAYNKHYWKIPIIYAGFGGLGYAVYYTASNYAGYRAAYRAQSADPNSTASYKGVNDYATLKVYRDYFKKNLDIAAICTGVWYALNLVDAAVDAHLFEWNMKDDLTLNWQPTMINSNTNYYTAAAAVQVTLHF